MTQQKYSPVFDYLSIKDHSIQAIIGNNWGFRTVSDNFWNPWFRPTQPTIPTGSVNEYQLRLGRKRQVWFILLADERGVRR